MILNNKFYIDNLKNVVFLGESEVFEELIEINDTFDIRTLVVTSSHQAHAIEKNINIKGKKDGRYLKFICHSLC